MMSKTYASRFAEMKQSTRDGITKLNEADEFRAAHSLQTLLIQLQSTEQVFINQGLIPDPNAPEPDAKAKAE